jgi:hypothetical protein
VHSRACARSARAPPPSSLTLSLPLTPIRAGNWNEDIARQEVAAKDYETRRGSGDLLYLRKRKEINFVTQAVPHSYSPDGLVRYGDTIQLATEAAGDARYVCCNPYMQVTTGHVRCTAGADPSPQARNTLVVHRAAKAGAGAGDDVVRYGDRVLLSCNPSLVADAVTRVVGLPFLLHSSMASNVLGTARRGRQEVTFSTKRDADAEWAVIHASGDRLLTDGEPVRVADAVALLHCMSNVLLSAVPSETYPTDCGVELDVHCLTHRATTHASMKSDGSMPVVRAEGPNRFRFVCAAEPAAAVDRRGLQPLTASALLDRARAEIASKCGIHGVRSLALAVSSLDAKGTGQVSADGVRWALYEHGVTLGPDEFTLLLGPFDPRGTGFLASAAFLSAVRGDGYTPMRAEAVQEAFGAVAAHAAAGSSASASSGAPTVAAVKKAFDARWDPRVQAKALTVEEARTEFGRQWPLHRKATDAVTAADFAAYHRDISPLVGDDLAFAELVANLWHVPERGNWRQKKGKRVQVTFFAGSATEAVIPGGETIADEDFEGLVSALSKLGMGGIARITVLGLVEPE